MFFKSTIIVAMLLTPIMGLSQTEEPVSFARQIQPILSKNCFACHGPDEDQRQSGLALHNSTFAYALADRGDPAIVPGDPQSSTLIQRISTDDESERMPPADHAVRLKPEEIDLLSRWITEGAKFELHWSYRPISNPELPKIVDDKWPKNAIDYFVLAKLEQAKLMPAAEAAPHRLVRRLYLDLIGLPPPPEKVREFVDAPTAQNYEKIVDALLSDVRFGEHWARMWLDLARYADSQGYAQDEIREIWKYRDWVIDAFNRDLPFDQFTIEQLAGDLLENPTEDQLIATAFHRNTMTNTEGGTDDEEFRHAAIVDRVNTTGIVWMGTTVGCAQCHTHKYDPITHKDYYRLFAIFNQTADNDQPDNSPLLQQYTAEQIAERERLQQEITKIDGEISAATAESKPPLEEKRKQLAGTRDAIRPVVTPIFRELAADKRRTTHVAIGGAFSNPGEVVEAKLLPFLDGGKNSVDNAAIDRLALAKWLVSADHPLTSRVAVNRIWEKFFGTGLVETSEDFGSQGIPPSHQELLDWLAYDFQKKGWSQKELCKTIVLSASYQQDSLTTPEKQQLDPSNHLLSRGSRFRMTGEQIRDFALAISGLLSSKMNGPPVQPPQPKSGLSAAFGGSLDWEPSAGEDRYRRAIYTLLRRTNPYPSFMAFDGTNRTVCTVRRIRTNTPVAAFVTLNDPVFIECAQAMARRLVKSAPDASASERIKLGFELAVSRNPSTIELAELEKLYQSELVRFQSDMESANLMASSELGPVPEQFEVPVLAALTVVSNVLLNLDESLTRN